MDKGIPLCQICKDTIWSFICPDCLAQDIKNWLPPSYSGEFLRFHENFSHYFRANLDTKFEHCLNCKTLSEASICPFCYIVEVYQWLNRVNKKMSKKLFKMLPLAKDWKITKMHGCVWREGFIPLTESRAIDKEFGICDDCGEYSDELVFINGKWVCRECTSQ